MPTPPLSYRKRRRALELLEASLDGSTEAIMLAHGFKIELLVELVRAGLATASTERMLASGRPMEITRLRITGPAGGRWRRFDGLDPQARIGSRLWDEWNDDDYNGLADAVAVGRIMKGAARGAAATPPSRCSRA
jgi:hypothetical protein